MKNSKADGSDWIAVEMVKYLYCVNRQILMFCSIISNKSTFLPKALNDTKQ